MSALVDGLTEAERAELDRKFREEHRHALDEVFGPLDVELDADAGDDQGEADEDLDEGEGGAHG